MARIRLLFNLRQQWLACDPREGLANYAMACETWHAVVTFDGAAPGDRTAAPSKAFTTAGSRR
jgi:hypothetical protein